MLHTPIRDSPTFYIPLKYLRNMEDVSGFVAGKIIAFSSYAGHAPTFQVLLENGALFSYLPTEAVHLRPSEADHFPWQGYKNCPGHDVAVVNLPLDKAVVFANKMQIEARYWFTADWFEANEQFSLFLCPEINGLIWAPNHKVLFGDACAGKAVLPSYLKLRKDWILS